jgi:hypothetical protein
MVEQKKHTDIERKRNRFLSYYKMRLQVVSRMQFKSAKSDGTKTLRDINWSVVELQGASGVVVVGAGHCGLSSGDTVAICRQSEGAKLI